MPSLKRRYRNFILFSSITVIVYGTYVLFYGWALQKGIFDPAVTGHLPMAIDAAYCFIITGISLACLITGRTAAHIVSRVLSASVFVWGIMMLIRDFTEVKVPFIFGMSPQTAFCFICLSISFFFLNAKKRTYIIQGLLHVVTLIASIAIIGHFLDIPEFYKMTFIPMSIYSAIGFVLLSVAASFINYNVGITALFTGNLIGNLMARKLFLQMLIATLVIGFFRIMAHRQEWVSPELGSALIIVVFILISLALIWKTSTILNRIDLKRKMAVENFRIAVESAPYALVISDREGKILTTNGQTEVLYGYTKQDLIGKPVMKIIPTQMHADYSQRRDKFFEDGQVVKLGGNNEEMLALRKNGTEFPIEITLVPIKTSMGLMCLASVMDITQRKNQEDTIKKQLIELQIKNEELEQFNYISSHDLQEPLRTVSNYIQMLEEDYPEQVNEEITGHLNTMRSAIDRMSHVVKSLLNFGKLGRKKKLVLTDCNVLLKDVITDLDSLIKSTGTKINVACGLPEFYAYETELRQLFQNLISNAIKFRKSNLAPEIHISSKKENGFHEFSVSDNGIGIDPKYSDKIFLIFHRLNNDEDYEGHGIGLANCKKIVEMHGGQIWVESEPGKGSIFKFTIINFKA